MNTNMLNIVKRIVAERGEGVLGDPQRLKAFFMDYAKDESKSERLAFGRCVEMGCYEELKDAHTAEERRRKKAVLADQLHAKTGIEREYCAGALDVLEAVVFGAASSGSAQVSVPAVEKPNSASATETSAKNSQRSSIVSAFVVILMVILYIGLVYTAIAIIGVWWLPGITIPGAICGAIYRAIERLYCLC